MKRNGTKNNVCFPAVYFVALDTLVSRNSRRLKDKEQVHGFTFKYQAHDRGSELTRRHNWVNKIYPQEFVMDLPECKVVNSQWFLIVVLVTLHFIGLYVMVTSNRALWITKFSLPVEMTDHPTSTNTEKVRLRISEFRKCFKLVALQNVTRKVLRVCVFRAIDTTNNTR